MEVSLCNPVQLSGVGMKQDKFNFPQSRASVTNSEKLKDSRVHDRAWNCNEVRERAKKVLH